MLRSFAFFLALVCASAVSAGSPDTAGVTQVTWGKWHISWGSDRVEVKTASKTYTLFEKKPGSYCTVGSVVGPWVSADCAWYEEEAGPSPNYGVGRLTVDVTRGGKVVGLDDVFPASDIYLALLNDSVIKKYLPTPTPRSLPELLDKLQDSHVCEMDMGDLRNGWGFHHVRGNQVAVRIGLSHVCRANRGTFTQIGIYLPIPETMRSLLKEADARGTLMEDLGQ